MLFLKNLTKKFSGQTIFSNASLALPDSGFFVLKGKNGSGKSTFFNLISGLDLDYQGTVELNGMRIGKSNCSEYLSQRVAYITQKPLLILDLGCIDNILYPYHSSDKKRAEKLLAEAGLSGLESEKAGDLSQGEKIRLSLARGFFKDPQIMLADEVTANLDMENAEKILSFLIKASSSTLVILSTNDSRLDSLEIMKSVSRLEISDYVIKASNNAAKASKPSDMAKNPIKKHLFIRKEIHNHFPLYLILMVISLIFSLGFSTVGCIYSAMGNEDAIREKTVESYIQNANGFLIKNEYKDSFSDSDCFYTTQTCSECSVFLAYSNTVGGKLDGIFVSDDLGSHGIELASLSGKALGSYPKNANDVLLSSYSYDYAISYYQNRKELSDMSEAEDRFFTDNEIPFSKGLLHVSGFYKPFGNNLGRYEAAIEENSSAIGQSSFGFGLDSMFAASVDVLSGEDRIPFIPSTQSSKDAIEPEMIDSWLLDKLVFGIRGRNQVFVFAGEDEVQTLLKFNSCGYIVWLVVLIYVLYFMISFLAYGIREKRKILICRVLGESRNRQIISISFSSLLFSLAGFVLSLALLPLSLFVTEKAFTSHLLGVDIGLIRFSAVYPAIFFAVILVCEGFLLLLTSSWLSPKDLSKQLPALGEGN